MKNKITIRYMSEEMATQYKKEKAPKEEKTESIGEKQMKAFLITLLKRPIDYKLTTYPL